MAGPPVAPPILIEKSPLSLRHLDREPEWPRQAAIPAAESDDQLLASLPATDAVKLANPFQRLL